MDKIVDFYNVGNEIKYPALDSKLTYDFLFRMKGSDIWFYVGSTNDLKYTESFIQDKGEYRIIEAKTGKVIKKTM